MCKYRVVMQFVCALLWSQCGDSCCVAMARFFAQKVCI